MGLKVVEVEIDSRYGSRHGSLSHYHQLHIPLHFLNHQHSYFLVFLTLMQNLNLILILPNAVSDSEDDRWEGFFQVAPTPIKR